MERATMTRKEASTYLGISKWLLWRLSKEGHIPYFLAGSRVLYRKEALEGWMKVQEQKIQEMTELYNKKLLVKN